ncbi:MAG: hypothetical protein IIB39_00900 [Candidatus Marinimicrobia bacterium]|nr:hypothetical protein [Candidatus Neomarinimicrobiota bacterium]
MAKALNDEPDYEAVIKSLYEKTKKGKIAWEQGDEPTKFRATLGDSVSFVVFLYVINAEEQESAFILRMHGADDVPIFAVSTTTPDLDEEYYDMITEIYRLAGRIAKRVDDQINAALKALKKA